MPILDLPARNERRKLTANFLNNLASVFVATGVISPIITLASDTSHPKSGYWLAVLLMSLIFGASLHLAARRILAGVE